MTGSTDSGWFTDTQDLGAFMTDMRAADTRTVSSLDDARSLLTEFAARSDVSPWTSLDRSDVADRLQELVVSPRSVQQGALNLCGPATFMCMWTARDPVGFATYATQLFETGVGQIGSLEVRPGNDLLTQDFAAMLGRMGGNPTRAADWMVLGALRNQADAFWQGSWTGDPTQQLAGLTRPEELTSWLQATGIYAQVHDQGNWVSPAGLPQAEGLMFTEGTDVALLIHLNLINTAEHKPKDSDFLLSQFPDHYVMLLNEVVADVSSDVVHLSVWTWGENKLDLAVPRQAFIDNYYGSVTAVLAPSS